MSDPINPNTLLPMSLQVDKLEQVRQLHGINEQSVLSQKQQKDDEKRNNQVNENRDTEQLIVDDGETQKNNQKEKNKQEREKNKNMKGGGSRGHYIDIKI